VTPVPPAQVDPLVIPEGVDDQTHAFPTDINPLTGLPVSDAALLDRRPMVIKVANFPRYVRPQSGLTLADQVFEYYIEDGLTRFIAVFYGNDSEWVGPVRSGRYFDEHIERMYHAFLVFKYADPREYAHFEQSDFADFLVVPGFGACPPFRESKRKIESYNNVYFNTTLWKDCADRQGVDNSRQNIRNGFFSGEPSQSDLLGLKMFVYYTDDSYHYWEYQPDVQQYIRYQETDSKRRDKPESYEMLTDAVTGEAVRAANVVVLFASHTFSNSFDEADEVYKIDLTGSGEAYVFRDGLGYIAHWYRLTIDQPLLLTGVDGNPIFMRPGITFYEVLGARSYVDQDAGEWNFHHSVP